MRRIVERADDDAVLAIARAFAREHEELAVGERHHVVHATRVRDDRIGDSGIGRIADVERVQHIAAAAGAEVGVLAVLMQPHFFRAESRARQPTHQRQRPPHVALGQRDGGVTLRVPNDAVTVYSPALVADERTVTFDRAVSRRKAPRRREPGDAFARGILRGDAKRITSPVRASTLAGDTDSDASEPAATVTGIAVLTPPTVAVIVALPASHGG